MANFQAFIHRLTQWPHPPTPFSSRRAVPRPPELDVGLVRRVGRIRGLRRQAVRPRARGDSPGLGGRRGETCSFGAASADARSPGWDGAPLSDVVFSGVSKSDSKFLIELSV